jgi:hypothetical protein
MHLSKIKRESLSNGQKKQTNSNAQTEDFTIEELLGPLREKIQRKLREEAEEAGRKGK